MSTLIKTDLKQRIKNPLTWFIIFILCLMSMLNIIEMKNKRLNRPFQGHDIYLWGSGQTYDWVQFMDEMEREAYPEAYLAHYLYTIIPEEFVKASEENNIKELMRTMTFYNLIRAKGGYVTNDPIMDTVFYNKTIDMWNDVSGGIAYEDVNFYPFGDVFSEGKYEPLLIAKYYYKLYKNDFEPIYENDINNITYLYDYFFNIVPKFIVIISIIFIYNTINKEKNRGSLKLVLTQSISRRKYYISKWTSGVIYVIFIFVFPAIIISLILGLLNGFAPIDYSTIYLKNSMKSFKSIPNYFDSVKSTWGNYPRLARTFSYFSPSYKVMANQAYPHERMEIIPFYKYLLIVLLLTILFIGFAVALIQLISAIINHEIISFVAATGVFIIGTLISAPFKYEKHLNLSPFTMENASRIVIGTYNITALTSILILLSSTILLLIVGGIYFRKKEI